MSIDKAAVLKKDFRTAFKGLKPRDKEVVLSRLNGKTLAETAKIIGITAQSVRRIENRSWMHLMDTLEMDNYMPDKALVDYKSSLSKRTLTTLVRNNIATVVELQRAVHNKNITKIKGLSQKARTEIERVLAGWRGRNNEIHAK